MSHDLKAGFSLLFKKIQNYEKIIIHTHYYPDGDAIGSQIGLMHLIVNNWKKKNVIIISEDTASRFWKILNFNNKNKTFLDKEEYKDALVIVCDTSTSERINCNYWNLGKEIIKIDHHPNGEKYANYEIIDEDAIATCEIITSWAIFYNLKFSKSSCESLLLGIITDSGRFLYNKTNRKTFLLVFKLLEQKVDLQLFYKKLYFQTLKDVEIKRNILNRIKITKNGVLYSVFGISFFKKNPHFKENEITEYVNILENIKEIKIWLVAAKENSKKSVKVSFRSNEIILNTIARKYGGGGHNYACGVKLKTWKLFHEFIKDLDFLASQNKTR